MWGKGEKLLSDCGLVLPAAGATKTSRQVASLSALAPHNVTSQQWKVGTEIKCDCPVYRSSPHICQHALAAAEDIGVLSEYLQWFLYEMSATREAFKNYYYKFPI